MSVNPPLTSCFDRWKASRFGNPDATLEDFERFKLQHKTTAVPGPAVMHMPDGTIVPVVNLSYGDIAMMNSNHVKESFNHQ